MKKLIILILAVLMLTTFTLVGCTDSQSKEIIFVVPDGAPVIAPAKMLAGDFTIQGYNIEHSVTTPQALQASLMNQEPDFAIAPINIAAMVSANYRVAAVTLFGIMHIVSNKNISSLEDLKGQTIVAFTKGGTPGITLRAVLTQNDIDFVEDEDSSYDVPAEVVHIIYLAEASDVVAAIVNGYVDGRPVEHALLAEPVATGISGKTSGQFTAKINIQTEWAAKNDGEVFPQAVLIFHKRLLENDSAFVNSFIELVEVSALYAKNNPEVVGNLAQEVLGSTAIAGAAVKGAYNAGRLSLDFTYAKDAKDAIINYLGVILAESPNLVGGSLPSDDFYYDATQQNN